MLEVKNLTKIYKPKKGAQVNALDGVTLQFPETGMVFLLGKSGSGKSTLLNVCGGLDSPTSGEVIVKGRSSKDFSQSDFDSYRNTFVGFIFQEYNILNEFSVEDNIALALELQGKSKDKQAIAALLEEVDLTGYAKRKPNTLSGGQKQRIAIARALVKKPEIIMADEPTGALDSNTGKQVFDTLKKLSKTKLVIVVSHDRDFAEQYGDRIIELKDGQVISDVSKTFAENTNISDNLSIVGDVMCIRKGTELTEHDFDRIKNFVKASYNDVVIASGEKSVQTFKTAARITDEGQMEVFRDTEEESVPTKQYTKEESRFIRSKLPMRHAFKIGVSGLKSKPIRLFFTVLLCSVAFILFGLLSTLNFYNSEATFRQTLLDTDISAVRLTKQYQMKYIWYRYGQEESSSDSWSETKFTPAEVLEIASQLNPNAFGAINGSGSFTLRQVEGVYWQNYINSFAVLPEGNSLRGQINGSYPTGKNEMALSQYFANMLLECKVYDTDGNVMELLSTDQLIGKAITLNSQTFTITGIIQTGEIPAEFEVLKSNEQQTNYTLRQKLMNLLESGLHTMVFVSNEAIDELTEDYYGYKEGKESYMRLCSGFKYDGEYQISEYSNVRYNGISALSPAEKLYFFSENMELSDDEIILPTNQVVDGILNALYRLNDEAHQNQDYERTEYLNTLITKAEQMRMGGSYVWPEQTGDKDDKEEPIEPVFVPLPDEDFDILVGELIHACQTEGVDLTVGLRLRDDYNQTYLGDVQIYKIAGLYKLLDYFYEPVYYMSDSKAEEIWNTQKDALPDFYDVITDYVEAPDALYSAIYLPGNVAADRIDAYWEVYSNEDFDANHSRIIMSGGLVSSLQMVDSFVESTSQICLYVGLVLAIFAALLLSNFISVSIANKTREIGILRAVGARSLDVFKIFFSESFVIGLICVLISGGVSYWLCNMINQEYSADLGVSVFVFGIPSIAVLIGIAAVTIVLATFLPVYNAARRKPVESIRAL